MFPECTETWSVILEGIDFHGTPDTPRLSIAEIEALGTSGKPRTPMSLNPQFAATSVDDVFWRTTNPGQQMYSGDTATRPWIDLLDGTGERRRIVQGHEIYCSGNGRYCMVYKKLSEYCPGAHNDTDQRYTLIDTHTRVFYATGFGNARGDKQLMSTFASTTRDLFVSTFYYITADDELTEVFEIQSDRTSLKTYSNVNDCFREHQKRTEGCPVSDELVNTRDHIAPESQRLDNKNMRHRYCRLVKKGLPDKVPDYPIDCREAVDGLKWYTVETSAKQRLVVAIEQWCMLYEEESGGFAMLLDENGTLLDVLGERTISDYRALPNGNALIEVRPLRKDHADTYIIRDGKFVKAHPSTALTLPGSSGCDCEA